MIKILTGCWVALFFSGALFAQFNHQSGGNYQDYNTNTQYYPEDLEFEEYSYDTPAAAPKLEDQYENLIVMFTKENCGYCRYMKPIMEEIKNRHGDKVEILFVDIDNYPQYPNQYGFTTVPQIYYFKNGKQLDAHGSEDKTVTIEQIEEKIKDYGLLGQDKN